MNMTPKDQKLFGCPACGMKITGDEKKCPRCGKKFSKNEKFACPFCGELIRRSSLKCPACRTDLTKLQEEAKPQSTDATVSELMSDLREIESSIGEEETYSCPTCGEVLSGKETKCPKCGQLLAGKFGLQCPICGTAIEKGFTRCPRCGISLEKVGREAKPVVPFDSRSRPGASGEFRTLDPSKTRPCHHCGAIVPKNLPRCPLCGTALEIVQQVAPPKERKLKTARVTTVPVSAQTGARGLTNGVGQVNGLGKVNGTGAVNGRAFVNGTGISNGLGPKQETSAEKRRSFITRWQFLAVLVAILIVIPTFIFLSYSNEPDKYAVDGDFSEWDDATIFGTRDWSTSTTSNITEWAVATQSSDLYLYFRTQAHMMSSTNAESYYLFVDSDGSSATGYITGSIGADYMLQLTGWNSTINSTSLSQYSSTSDQYDWSNWSSVGSLSCAVDLVLLEARAAMPVELGDSAKFLLVSKDSEERGSVSHTAPLKGGTLVVRQKPTDDVSSDGIIPRSASASMLTLTFTCEGEGGQVTRVSPALSGASLAFQDPAFSLERGEEHVMTIVVDTSTATDGQFVSAEVLASGITSSFEVVEVIGEGASAYAGSPPTGIAIDGAFADWAGLLSFDPVSTPVPMKNLDIDEVGNVSTSTRSFFYVSVVGDICAGTYVPASVAKPSGTGGGGSVVHARHTAEDTLTIYVDSDRTSSSGAQVSLDSKLIGADQKIELKGLFGEITSKRGFDFSALTSDWVESYDTINAAKDSQRIEVEVPASSVGDSADIDFIVETTSWKGRSDLATFDPSAMRALTRSWVVDPATASPSATSMSYQRKMFYDGVNYWSFYFDGVDTVCKYSMDDGENWTYSGRVFTTEGVAETSIWYDSSTTTVYAVGDNSTATNNVSIQVGVVDPYAHTISWAASDSILNASSFPLAGKNTFICKDTNGYLWVLSSNSTTLLAGAYQLSAFKSNEVNSASSWTFSGQMLAATQALDNVKGSIVPAGSGSDVWAVYAYGGRVDARKNNGSWLAPQSVCPVGPSKVNTDNSPPSVVVDGKGVVHVVYGTGRKAGPNSIPVIEYSHNNTDQTTFTAGVSLDPFMPADTGGYYPTISFERDTGVLYVLWLQNDATMQLRTVVGRMCVSGTWYNFTIEQQTQDSKQYLTSVYSVPGLLRICWQWTQNTTAPIEVTFDRFQVQIPEFGDIVLPLIGVTVIVAISRRTLRTRD